MRKGKMTETWWLVVAKVLLNEIFICENSRDNDKVLKLWNRKFSTKLKTRRI